MPDVREVVISGGDSLSASALARIAASAVDRFAEDWPRIWSEASDPHGSRLSLWPSGLGGTIEALISIKAVVIGAPMAVALSRSAPSGNMIRVRVPFALDVMFAEELLNILFYQAWHSSIQLPLEGDIKIVAHRNAALLWR